MTLKEEYGRVWPRLPVSSKLYVSCRLSEDEGYDDRMYYHGMVILRGQLTAATEVGSSFEDGEMNRVAHPYDGRPGRRVGEFLDSQQEAWRGDPRYEIYGERIVVEAGDEATQEMLEGLPTEQRYDGLNREWVDELTKRMLKYHSA